LTDIDFSLPPAEEVRAEYATLAIPAGRLVCVEHEALDRSARSRLGILAPVMYAITASKQDRDRLFMARVVKEGPPRDEENLPFPENTIVLASLYNVGYKFTRARKRHYRIDARQICGTLNPETLEVKPSGAYVRVVPAEEEAQEIINPGGKLWMSDQELGRTDDIAHDQGIKAKYGRVVELGPGTTLDGERIQPSDYCQVDDIIQYDCAYHTLPLRIRGKVCELVECRQVIAAERGIPKKEQRDQECQTSNQNPSEPPESPQPPESRSSVFLSSSFPPPAGLRSVLYPQK